MMERFTIHIVRQGDKFTVLRGDYSYSSHLIDAETFEQAEQQALQNAKELADVAKS